MAEQSAQARKRPWIFAIAGGVVLLALFVAGFVPRIIQRSHLRQDEEAAEEPPRMQIVPAQRGPADVVDTLPGNAVPLQETNIFARVNGYLKRRLVDIGDNVEKNQMLAELDTPELDAQLNQAIATLGQSRANLFVAIANFNYAEADYKRFSTVYASGGVSKEEYELRKASLESNRASVEAGKANIAANEANVRNLSAMQEFKKVFAPFAGTITERQVEIGALVSSGSITGNMPLFHLADSRTLRVFVNVPQMLAPTVFNDQPADVSVDQFPNQLFKGRIVRSSGAVDASTRTMLTEVHIPNDEHKLMPGIFVGVKLRFHRTIPPVIIPAAALVMRSHGAFVALIQPGDKVHFQPVVVGRDLGTAIELSSGVNEGDRLGMNVGEDILEGQVITPVPYVPSTPNQPAQPKVAANN